MTTAAATLAKVVLDPRSGEVHRPAEQVAILAVVRNLNRALLKVHGKPGPIAWCSQKTWTNAARTIACDASARDRLGRGQQPA